MVTSPSANGEALLASGHGDQKRGLGETFTQVTIESSGTAPYKHDSKHMQESSRQSMVKLTVPKTVLVEQLAGGLDP